MCEFMGGYEGQKKLYDARASEAQADHDAKSKQMAGVKGSIHEPKSFNIKSK